MAGWTLRSLNSESSNLISRIQKNVRYLGIFGLNWRKQLAQHSHSVGIAESQLDSMYGQYYQSGVYPGSDYGQKDFIAFYDKEYPTRRDFLRKFAMNGEVENIIEIIADETIIYDDNNYIGYPNTQQLRGILKKDKGKEIVDDLNESYKQIYYAFGFNEGHDAWHYMKKFLIDGFLSFEIIYDENDEDNAKEVIGFKELDPISLEPEMRMGEDGNDYRVWVQYRGDVDKQRELLDSNLIYISWARGNFISRLSYVERLVRSFNMLRTLENSRIIWNVWNSQMRVKIVVPIGTQSEAKARTRLSELRGMYREELNINDQSGEVTFNGQPNFSFAKTYVIPSRNGEQTDIDGFQPQGYDLSDTDSLKYFWQRFILETKVPQSRFSNDPGQGSQSTWGAGAEGVEREEIRFSRFLDRIRSTFQELLLKPTWLQFLLKHPEFNSDYKLRGAVGINFIDENYFRLAKEREIAKTGAETVSTLMGITEKRIGVDGEVDESATFFDPKFLVEKYMSLTDDDINLNNKYKKEREAILRKSKARADAAAEEEEEEELGGAGAELGGFGGEEEGGEEEI